MSPKIRISAKFSAWLSESRATLTLGLPLAATQLAQMAVMTTDTIMIGRLGALPLAAGAIGFTLYVFGWFVASGPVWAVSPIIAQALGRDPNDTATPRQALRMSFWGALLMCVPVFGLYLGAPHVMRLLHQDEKVIALAAPYVLALAPSVVFALWYMALRNFLSALGRTRAALIIGCALVIINAVLDYGFIYGHLGFPRLGVIGAGVATSLSSATSFVALLVYVLVSPAYRRFELTKSLWRPRFDKLRELFRVGLPISITMGFEITLFQAGTFLNGMIGTAEIAANQIALNVASITFMVPLGIAMAGTVRVGRAAGALDFGGVRRAAATAVALGAGFMALAGGAIILFRSQISALYIDANDPANARVVALAYSFLALAALFQVFDAIQVTAAHALRGLKDTRVPAYLAGFSYWLIGLPAAIACAFWLHLGGIGIWIGYVVGLAAAASAMLARLYLLTRNRSQPLTECLDTNQPAPQHLHG